MTRQTPWALPFFIAVVGMCVTNDLYAQRATMQFPVARETSIDGWDSHPGYGDPPIFDKTLETEEWTSFGASLSVRARKGNQHAAIMDWDTDAINAFLAANADTTQPMNWTLNVYPTGNADLTFDVTIETLESLNDWVEGNGGYFDFDEDGDAGAYENFNWEPGTKAATASFAQAAFMIDDDGDPVLDFENSVPWVDNDAGTGGIDDNQYGILGRAANWSQGQPIPDFINSELLLLDDVADAVADATYASVPLDDALINAILTDPNNRGVIFGPANGAQFDNWEIYSRENDGFGDLADELPGPLAAFLEVSYVPGATPSGDFDASGSLDAADINDLTMQSASTSHPAAYDLNSDALVDQADIRVWVKDLFNSWIGDANLDGEFNSSDLVQVLASGTYEVDVDSNWSTGDFNGDGRTNSSDLVAGLADGGYELNPAAAVPEPQALALCASAAALTLSARRANLRRSRGT